MMGGRGSSGGFKYGAGQVLVGDNIGSMLRGGGTSPIGIGQERAAAADAAKRANISVAQDTRERVVSNEELSQREITELMNIKKVRGKEEWRASNGTTITTNRILSPEKPYVVNKGTTFEFTSSLDEAKKVATENFRFNGGMWEVYNKKKRR